MYSETQESIRNSLWNFMGAILTSSIVEDRRKKENVTALMCEELCKFCKNEDEQTVDVQATKPILKAAVWALQARKQEIENSKDNLSNDLLKSSVNESIKELSNLIDAINTYTQKL